MLSTIAIAVIASSTSIMLGDHSLPANTNTAKSPVKTTVHQEPSRPSVTLASNSTPTPPPAPEAPQMVTVQPGDYLEKIAQANNTTALRIFYANTDIADPNVIHPNQQLRIPKADEALEPRAVPVPAPAPVPTPAPVAAAPVARQSAPVSTPALSVAGGSVWDSLAACESGGNWAINTGNGYYGGLQFSLSSWRAVGGSGLPSQASREEQILRGQMLQSRGGWGNWPACSAKLGLR